MIAESKELLKQFDGRESFEAIGILMAAASEIIGELPRPHRAAACADAVAALIAIIVNIPDPPTDQMKSNDGEHIQLRFLQRALDNLHGLRGAAESNGEPKLAAFLGAACKAVELAIMEVTKPQANS